MRKNKNYRTLPEKKKISSHMHAKPLFAHRLLTAKWLLPGRVRKIIALGCKIITLGYKSFY